jgi:hypothetical protein
MPGPYYASYTEKTTTPLFKVGSVEKMHIPNTDNYHKLVPRGYIDVRKDFSWTVSPKHQVLDKVPACYLVERELQQNSLISSALYYVNALTSSGNIDAIADKLTSILAKISPDAGASAESAKAKLDKFRSKITSLAATANDKSLLGDLLQSYIGIYFTQPTSFKYILPYLDNSFIKQSNRFDAAQQNPGFGAGVVTDTLMPFVDTAAATGNLFTPGTYIEKPKYFQYPGEGETFTISFPLLNTFTSKNYLPYVQNYELLWILSYQNKPYRTSFSRILPPKLYSVYVPGVRFVPYAYISDMTVDFVGTKRLLDVTLPNGKTVKPPIPEAYQVNLTFTSLLANIGNTMVDDGFGASSIIIE